MLDGVRDFIEHFGDGDAGCRDASDACDDRQRVAHVGVMPESDSCKAGVEPSFMRFTRSPASFSIWWWLRCSLASLTGSDDTS